MNRIVLPLILLTAGLLIGGYLLTIDNVILGILVVALGALLGIAAWLSSATTSAPQTCAEQRTTDPQVSPQFMDTLGKHIVETIVSILAAIAAGTLSWLLYWHEGMSGLVFLMVPLAPIISVWILRRQSQQSEATGRQRNEDKNMMLEVLKWYGAGKALNGFFALAALSTITLLLYDTLFSMWPNTVAVTIAFFSIGSMIARQLAGVSEKQTPKDRDSEEEEDTPPSS